MHSLVVTFRAVVALGVGVDNQQVVSRMDELYEPQLILNFCNTTLGWYLLVVPRSRIRYQVAVLQRFSGYETGYRHKGYRAAS